MKNSNRGARPMLLCRWLFCVAIAASTFACARQFEPTLTPPSDLTASDYASVLALWTREDVGYKVFEHKLSMKATLITPMLRRAFQIRFPDVYGYGGVVTKRELSESTASEETVNLFLAVQTAQPRWNDLHKPDSIWHVTLERLDSDGSVALTVDAKSIEKVKLDENLLTIYPHTSRFDEAYVARFPTNKDGRLLITDTVSYLRLRVVSSFSKVEMNWQLKP